MRDSTTSGITPRKRLSKQGDATGSGGEEKKNKKGSDRGRVEDCLTLDREAKERGGSSRENKVVLFQKIRAGKKLKGKEGSGQKLRGEGLSEGLSPSSTERL